MLDSVYSVDSVQCADVERGQMPESLSDEEINEFAKLFPPDAITRNALRRAGFDVTRLPAIVPGQSASEFWHLINQAIGDGIFDHGRRRLLAMVARSHPFNPVLFGRRPPRVWRVAFLGASPMSPTPGDRTLSDLRTDREYRAVLDAGAAIDVRYYPFANTEDVRAAHRHEPHILHLACHGNGPWLTFEDRSARGQAKPIHAADLAAALAMYRPRSDANLFGIVLNACRSDEAAHTLLPCADVVVAHSRDLPDDAAVVLAGQLYTALSGGVSLVRAATTIKTDLPLHDPELRSVAAGLVVLER